MHCLGRDYIVWDKAGEIEFVEPGRGTSSPNSGGRSGAGPAACRHGRRRKSAALVRNRHIRKGEVVARVRKQLYVRLKRKD